MSLNTGVAFTISAQVNGQQAVEAFKGSLNSLNKAAKDTSQSFNSISTGLKAFVGGLVVSEVAGFFKEIVNLGDEFSTLSERLGVSVRELSALKTAGELSNVSFESLQGGLNKLNTKLFEASTGSREAQALFKSLGVQFKDLETGKTRPLEAAFNDIADKFKDLEDGPEKAAIASKLFGKTLGAEVVPVLNMGSEAIKKLGLNLSDDFAARADQFNDSMLLLRNSAKNFAIEGFAKVLPTLQELVKAFSEVDTQSKGALGFFDGLSEALRFTAIGAETLYQTFIDTVDVLISNGKQLFDFFENSRKVIVASIKGQHEERERLELEYTKRSDQRELDFLNRSIKRQEEILSFKNKILKNSETLGNGLQGALADTAPSVRKKGGQSVDTKALNLENTNEIEKGTKATLERINTINGETDALGQNAETKRLIVELTELENRGIKSSTDLYADLAIKISEALEKQEEQKNLLKADPFKGAKDGLKDYIDQVKDAAKLTKDAMSKSLSSLEDTFVDFFKTGSFQWKKFADTVITEIIRIAVKKAIIAPLAQGALDLIGFADGGVMTAQGEMPLKKYANGGIANTPQVALFGEGRRPEAFVPLPDGRRIPVAMQGGENKVGGGVSVQVNVNLESGKTDTKSDNGDASKLGLLVAGVVKAELINQKRQGGLLAS